jgi:hypothetical protein
MAKTSNLVVKNKTGATLKANTLVRITGNSNDDDQLITVDIASNDSENTMPAAGMVIDDISPNKNGNVRIFGSVGGFDTSKTAPNTLVYVGRSGEITFTKPSETSEIIQHIGVVVNVSESPGGIIYLYPIEIQIKHADIHAIGKYDQFIHANQHETGGGDEITHGKLLGLDIDDHAQYILTDGSRAFTSPVSSPDPSDDTHLATKKYINDLGIRLTGGNLGIGVSGNNSMIVGSSGGVIIGAPLGGNQGAGTLNAVAVFDDGVLLTCYVPEYIKQGNVDIEKWDKTIPVMNGRHHAARRFAKNAKEELNPKQYAEKWLKDGHLPSMPSPKEWEQAGKSMSVGKIIQGLWETTEVLAEHIRQLNLRIEDLEGEK